MQVEAYELEHGNCPEHGGPRSECSDPHRDWFPQRKVCHAAMEEAAANWRYDQIHDERPFHDGTFKAWAKDRSASHPYHFRDGVSIWVAPQDFNPDDKFLDRR